MTSIHLQTMTNNNNNAVKTSFVKRAAKAVAFAATPFAIALGIGVINAPTAEAASCRYEYAGGQMVHICCTSQGQCWVQR